MNNPIIDLTQPKPQPKKLTLADVPNGGKFVDDGGLLCHKINSTAWFVEAYQTGSNFGSAEVHRDKPAGIARILGCHDYKF